MQSDQENPLHGIAAWVNDHYIAPSIAWSPPERDCMIIDSDMSQDELNTADGGLTIFWRLTS